MAEQSRELRLSATFVTLADTLVADYDVVDFLDTLINACVDLSAADAGGLLLADGTGALQLIASTQEDAAFVEVIQLETGQGPCLEAYETRAQVGMPRLSEDDRWPEFAAVAISRGFVSMHAFPLSLRDRSIGAMGLFSATTQDLSDADISIVQAMADVATIGVLHEQSLRNSQMVADQLQHALSSRVLIEQAKGVIAAQAGVDIHTAFNILRSYARAHQLKLSDVAERVSERELILTDLAPAPAD